MKTFIPLQYDEQQCLKEIQEFRDLLLLKSELGETSDLAPFFKKRPQLMCRIGEYCPDLFGNMDEYAYEFPIKDDFTADIVLRNKRCKTLLFIELEDATKESMFKKIPRYYTDWGFRLEHGLGQITDWFWKLSDMEKTDDFEEKIGKNYTYHGLLVIGRNQFIDTKDFKRLEWRFSKTMVNSKFIKCITYDQLLEMFENTII